MKQTTQIFLKLHFFFVVWPFVQTVLGHWIQTFLKTPSRLKIFRNYGFRVETGEILWPVTTLASNNYENKSIEGKQLLWLSNFFSLFLLLFLIYLKVCIPVLLFLFFIYFLFVIKLNPVLNGQVIHFYNQLSIYWLEFC